MPDNIFAYTAPGSDMPEYVSVNRTETGVDLIIRSPKGIGGSTAQVTLTNDQAASLGAALALPDEANEDEVIAAEGERP